MGTTMIDLEPAPAHETRLLHRRQFLLGPSAHLPNAHWNARPLSNGWILSTHTDLPVSHATWGCRSTTLIGYAIDPLHPAHTEKDVVERLNRAVSREGLLKATFQLSGRWLVVRFDARGGVLFADPFASRTVHYARASGYVWVGSQPSLIASRLDLQENTDHDFRSFCSSKAFAYTERAHVGEATKYAGCFRLLPNHALDLASGQRRRWYPAWPLERRTLRQAVPLAAQILRGTFEAAVQRYDLRLAVTAGWDSRVLLAAGKEHLQRMHLSVDRMGVLGVGHRDITIPRRLEEVTGVSVEAVNSTELPEFFSRLLENSVTGARRLPKSCSIFSRFRDWPQNAIDVNGNGGEITRNAYDKYNVFRARRLSGRQLAHMMRFDEEAYARRALGEWADELYGRLPEGFRILDLLYWEQRVGIWAAMYASEHDIAAESLSPFNNRLLLETLLSVSARLRTAPHYPLHRRLIRTLWPDVASVPINPGRRKRIDRLVRWLPGPVIRHVLLSRYT